MHSVYTWQIIFRITRKFNFRPFFQMKINIAFQYNTPRLPFSRRDNNLPPTFLTGFHYQTINQFSYRLVGSNCIIFYVNSIIGKRRIFQQVHLKRKIMKRLDKLWHNFCTYVVSLWYITFHLNRQ